MNTNLYDQLKNKPYYIPLTIKGEVLRREFDGKDVVKNETINNYEVIKRIGEGAFSKVYEAHYVGLEGRGRHEVRAESFGQAEAQRRNQDRPEDGRASLRQSLRLHS